MTRFGFVIHPLFPKDLGRYYPVARFFPDKMIEYFTERKSPVVASHVTGIRSKTGAETEGWFIGLPLTPDQMVRQLPIEFVYERIIRCCEVAAEQGAQLIGLGAFSSVVGDGGITVAKRSPIGVTTGNSYTVATAIAGTLKAAELLEIDTQNATLAVVGATGSIGKTCAQVLSRDFGQTILVGRDEERTGLVAATISGAQVSTSVESVRDADVVVTVSSAAEELIMPEHLRPGAVVCDVARPRDVSVRVAKERNDVLVIEGGVVRVPGNVEFNLDFGFPKKTAYACMSETMMLALEGNPDLFNFTLGKEVSVEQVDTMNILAAKHGFELAGFRSFEKAVTEEAIQRAKKARVTAPSVPRQRV